MEDFTLCFSPSSFFSNSIFQINQSIFFKVGVAFTMVPDDEECPGLADFLWSP